MRIDGVSQSPRLIATPLKVVTSPEAMLGQINGNQSQLMQKLLGGGGAVAEDRRPMAAAGDWSRGAASVSNNPPEMYLKCADCSVAKKSTEEMEVHIKQEHLNWLPFQCPICLTERASDAQMREHLHSSHKKNMNKFIYVDNVSAKRQLQLMMDRTLVAAMGRRPTVPGGGRPASGSAYSISPPNINGRNELSPVALSPSRSASPPRATATVVIGARKRTAEEAAQSEHMNALLANINAAAGMGAVAGGVEDENNDDSNDALSRLFDTKRVKSEFDVPDENVDDSALFNPSVLDDVAALFAASGGALAEEMRRESLALSKPALALNGFKPTSSSVSKKRVLGECSKCQKPVTAGARQMHLFFHLGKDHNIYRFRCKFEGCSVEHYRKDQMENHQTKMHGRIDHELMEDRSVELHSICQELSMELLGTCSGATPGPTAAKAQALYDEQGNSKIKISLRRDGGELRPSVPDDEHPLQCQICQKTMQNRIRGFHVLWHMARDMGINRYTCKHCDFGHDRSQSVQTHGKRVHGSEDVVEDRIKEYENEVKEMSMKCFGFQALFGQDSKRRSKIPMATTPLRQKPENGEEGSKESSEGPVEEMDGDMDEMEGAGSEGAEFVEEQKEEEEEEEVEEPGKEDEPEVEEEQEDEEEMEAEKPTPTKSAHKRSSQRRFGTRVRTSKDKLLEMARLREVSKLLGGAQYIKKKASEAVHCEKCDTLTSSRLPAHAYMHLDEELFVCPHCDLGHSVRDTVVRHIKDMHNSNESPVDERLRYAQEIKDMIKECFPACFVDLPIPTAADVDKIKNGQLKSAGSGEYDEGEEHEEALDEEM